jgi:TPR repeat protein
MIDWKGEEQYFKLAADQGDAVAQNNYGLCLQNGKEVSIAWKGAVDYFEFAADQGVFQEGC